MTVSVIITVVMLAGLVALTLISRKWDKKRRVVVNGAISAVGLVGTIAVSIPDYGVSEAVAEDFGFYLRVSHLATLLIFVLMLIQGIRILVEGSADKYGRMLLTTVPLLTSALVLMLATLSVVYFEGLCSVAVVLTGVFETMALRVPETVSNLGFTKKKEVNE